MAIATVLFLTSCQKQCANVQCANGNSAYENAYGGCVCPNGVGGPAGNGTIGNGNNGNGQGDGNTMPPLSLNNNYYLISSACTQYATLETGNGTSNFDYASNDVALSISSAMLYANNGTKYYQIVAEATYVSAPYYEQRCIAQGSQTCPLYVGIINGVSVYMWDSWIGGGWTKVK
ncbi:MAG: hypothetical protein OEX08_00255 [Candidatus Nomurabacteria bacterium]|nr:hypothetical protein [Candidatus Nomurabacteria bacterium]